MSIADAFCFGGAGLMLILVPFVPNILNLRILVLRKVHLFRLAEWHEKHRSGIIVFARIIMPTMALILLIIGLSQ